MPSFMRRINVISRCATMYRQDSLAEDTDLAGSHCTYIMVLCRHPGISQEEISRRVYINKSNVTRHLAQLEKKGYVERRQSEDDRRVTLVYPTKKAEDILPRVNRVMREWREYLTADFSPEELEQFNAMLARMTKRATEAVNRSFESE